MLVREFDFDLPSELIAQEPPLERGGARLLHLSRDGGAIAHAFVRELPRLLRPGDLVVVGRRHPADVGGARSPWTVPEAGRPHDVR